MDMQWLDDVLVLLEEGNLTRAAARRNITQPAFSRRIRSFEDWLGDDRAGPWHQPGRDQRSPNVERGRDPCTGGRIRDLRTKLRTSTRQAPPSPLPHSMHRCFPHFRTWRCGPNTICLRSSSACAPATCAIASPCCCAVMQVCCSVTNRPMPMPCPLARPSGVDCGAWIIWFRWWADRCATPSRSTGNCRRYACSRIS